MAHAQGRADRHAPLGRRQDAPDLPRPVARPDRLSRRVPDRHARHRHHEPAVRTLSAPATGPIEGRRNGVLISNARRRGGRLCAVQPGGARHAVRRPGRQGLCRA